MLAAARRADLSEIPVLNLAAVMKGEGLGDLPAMLRRELVVIDLWLLGHYGMPAFVLNAANASAVGKVYVLPPACTLKVCIRWNGSP